MSLTILIAPSGFKESLSAQEVAENIAAGVLRAMPDANIIKAPMVDGGEGFTAALVDATHGAMHSVKVTGPLGQPVDSFFGFLGGRDRKTAVIEMAAAAGLRLVPRDRRDPTKTTSYGVGELIRAALDAGAQRILLGCGDSGINDGGAGMVQALGARLLDDEGKAIGWGGGELARIAHIDLSELDPRLAHVQLDAAVNWHNVLLGERGVARVFGPQKGATPEQVELLGSSAGKLRCTHTRSDWIGYRSRQWQRRLGRARRRFRRPVGRHASPSLRNRHAIPRTRQPDSTSRLGIDGRRQPRRANALRKNSG